MSKNQESDPLFQFLAGYFHQDWMMDWNTSDEVVENFLLEAKPDSIESIYKELRSLNSQDLPNEILEQLLTQKYYCFFDPNSDEQSYKDWLSWLEERFKSSLDIQ